MTRKTYTAEYKTKLVLEAIREESRLEEIAAANEINPNMCRNQSEGGVVSGFKPLLNIRASVNAVIDAFFVLLTLGDSDTRHIRCLVKKWRGAFISVRKDLINSVSLCF